VAWITRTHTERSTDAVTSEERICPVSERKYYFLCNQGLCIKNAAGDSGYCKYHASMKYARREKLIRRVGAWVAFAVVGPPVIVVIAGLLWRLAIWAVLT
jgi:hypothetical protein